MPFKLGRTLLVNLYWVSGSPHGAVPLLCVPNPAVIRSGVSQPREIFLLSAFYFPYVLLASKWASNSFAYRDSDVSTATGD
jgi:hypothetical protein